ncbi:pectin methylesterase family protein [Corynespora cassiicola Philippines]|uniref:pectinesterase n=1 Tax=Corynespora cassiicola Philippines TaxID=1448308 RepID=A0A2T2NZD0_CORCC|nr:pectin methylesterase family protein [Corynespora cassiicola Philippines]
MILSKTLLATAICAPALCIPLTGAEENFDYSLCQYPTDNVLNGCPRGTIVVGQNGSHADFAQIQTAIESIPNDTSTHHILVLAGDYREQLNMTRQAPVRLIGQTFNAKNQSKNLVTVTWASANGAGSGLTDNAFTSVITVAPTLNASLTGSGPTGFYVPPSTPFGNSDFRAYNLNFRNIFAEQSAGPSLAVSVSRANAGFYHCGFYSYQDTVYVGKLGNAYFYECEIAGQTDFLYGFGTAWIEKSQLTLRGCGGGIIAWKGTNTTFSNKYGCYVSNSNILAANATVKANNKGKCSLGRPWNSLHRSLYLDTFMDTSILPQGYTKWGNNPATWNYNNFTVMAEYESFGPGWNASARVLGNVTQVMNKASVLPYYSPWRVFMRPNSSKPNADWIDRRFL